MEAFKGRSSLVGFVASVAALSFLSGVACSLVLVAVSGGEDPASILDRYNARRLRQAQFADSSDQGDDLEIDTFYHDCLLGFATIPLGLRVVISLIVVWFYYSRVTSNRPEWESRSSQPSQDFSISACGCCETCDYFCAGFCCLFVRAADTVEATGVWSYWGFVLVLLGIQVLGSLVAIVLPLIGILIYWLGQSVILIYARVKIRAALGLKDSLVPLDVLMWCFFPCCAAVQEAREVDRATDTKVIFCCALAKTDGIISLVGDPARTYAPVTPR